MAQFMFHASRVSGDGNAVFPGKIFIDTEIQEVVLRKQKLIGYHETKMKFDAIACIDINKHLFFSDILIETRGGRVIEAKGFKRSDAEKIKDLLSL